MECSSNYQDFTDIRSDQSMILTFKILVTSYFLTNLDFFHFSNGESSLVGTICLEVPITMTFKILLTLQPL